MRYLRVQCVCMGNEAYMHEFQKFVALAVWLLLFKQNNKYPKAITIYYYTSEFERFCVWEL